MSQEPPSSQRPADEPTVKQLLEDPQAHSEALDAATLAELHRWFGKPSAMDLPPEEPPPPEYEVRRAAALAAVEPWFLTYLNRHEDRLAFMFEPPSHDSVIKEALLTVPESFSGVGRLGEPREIEISYLLEDDLKERVPQALLRDLHRPEQYFGRTMELTLVAEAIPDVRRQIAEAIASGEAERQPVSTRLLMDQAIAERLDARRLVPWETLSRAVQSDVADAADVERDPSS
ncbi:MAG TPA: hypothetical protein PKU97_05145 [Kofleriaceae bacterium]|nr:hypothetical protein [Kofleriaceae bacterium]